MGRPLLSGLARFRPAVLSLRGGYTRADLLRDIVAGCTVGIVALPLAMAFAIASGAPPERGLFTAIVAGFLISALGGSRVQIGGPTGAFVVIVSSIIARHGYEGLVVATIMAGAILVVMGLLKFGRLLQFIPYPVTTGFTAGIGLIIFTSQLKDLFGLPLEQVPSAFWDKIVACGTALPHLAPASLAISLGTLAVMLGIRKWCPRVPAHIMGILAATVCVWALGLDVPTIGTRFGGIPSGLPGFAPPSNFLALCGEMVPDAVTIALLAGIESLLSAVVADGMTGERHDSSTELMAQGVANIASACFGGIPATGAIARTATNIRAGGRSPVSGIVHAATLALFMVACASLGALIPLPSLAAVMVLVAWDMSEVHRFKRLLRAPKSDAAVLLATFLLTVLVDLTVAVQVGVVLAALLFMRRMSELTDIQPVVSRRQEEEGEGDACAMPMGNARVLIYEIEGPFFFGMARRFADVMQFTRERPDVCILRMRHVPSIDATGADALEGVIRSMRSRGTEVVLSGVNERVLQTLRKLGTEDLVGSGNIFREFPKAMLRVRELEHVLESEKVELETGDGAGAGAQPA